MKTTSATKSNRFILRMFRMLEFVPFQVAQHSKFRSHFLRISLNHTIDRFPPII